MAVGASNNAQKKTQIGWYKAMEVELKEKYMGKWVGFYDGQLVAKERTIRMRSPRRFFPRKSS